MGLPIDDHAVIENLFIEIGLTGEALEGHAVPRYFLGDRFYQWVTFMGCAPSLKLAPDDAADEKFCHIRFTRHNEPQFQYLRPAVKGRCPACTKPGLTAASFMQQKLLQQTTWTCPHCQYTCSPLALNWKNEAGVGRFFIELMDVHPHEAIPVDGLLHRLAEMTGTRWQYFYV